MSEKKFDWRKKVTKPEKEPKKPRRNFCDESKDHKAEMWGKKK